MKHNIKNDDGSISKYCWTIDDKLVFEKMIAEIEEQLKALELPKYEKLLFAAEDELIKFGLSLLPKENENERKLLENVCFGLNGHYRNLDKREKVIDLVLKLDVQTLPKESGLEN